MGLGHVAIYGEPLLLSMEPLCPPWLHSKYTIASSPSKIAT